MSLAITNVDAPSRDPSAARSRLHLAARILAWREARRHHRQQMRQLRAMDAHLLAGLGISRAQAESLAQQPYAGDWCTDAFTSFMHQRPSFMFFINSQTPAVASVWIDALVRGLFPSRQR